MDFYFPKILKTESKDAPIGTLANASTVPPEMFSQSNFADKLD